MKSKMWILGLGVLLAVAGVAVGTTYDEALAAVDGDQYIQVNSGEIPLYWSITVEFSEGLTLPNYIFVHFRESPASTNFQVQLFNGDSAVTSPNQQWSWSGSFLLAIPSGQTVDRVLIKQRQQAGEGTVYLDAVTNAVYNVGNGTWEPGDTYAHYYGHYGEATAFPETQDPTPIDIDIKPGSYPNSINLGANGVVPVAILSTSAFDATALSPDTVFLAGAGVAVRGKGNNTLASSEDVNGDGILDLVLKVETENLEPGQFQDGYAVLKVHETSDQASPVLYQGSDEITIVPPE